MVLTVCELLLSRIVLLIIAVSLQKHVLSQMFFFNYLEVHSAILIKYTFCQIEHIAPHGLLASMVCSVCVIKDPPMFTVLTLETGRTHSSSDQPINMFRFNFMLLQDHRTDGFN